MRVKQCLILHAQLLAPVLVFPLSMLTGGILLTHAATTPGRTRLRKIHAEQLAH